MPRIELPGAIDAHVHMRDPGLTQKEDWYSGTCAALRAGVVAVLDMPNNVPPVVDEASLRCKQQAAQARAVCDYGLFIAAGAQNAGSAGALREPVGLKMYLGETFGHLRIDNLDVAARHFQAWPRGRPVAVHAEGFMVAVAIALGRLFDQHVHVCHVARRTEIELLRRAKQRGLNVTCEVTPHHLFLTAEDQQGLGQLAHMKPSLGSHDDVSALWQNLDVIDLIATDHAPHTLEEKHVAQPPPGIPGLETMLPLLLTAVAEKRLSFERLMDLVVVGPARVYGLEVPASSQVVVDTDASYELHAKDLSTKCGWTPFEGWRVRGRILSTTLRGMLVYDGAQVLAPPGYGQPICVRWSDRRLGTKHSSP